MLGSSCSPCCASCSDIGGIKIYSTGGVSNSLPWQVGGSAPLVGPANPSTTGSVGPQAAVGLYSGTTEWSYSYTYSDCLYLFSWTSEFIYNDPDNFPTSNINETASVSLTVGTSDVLVVTQYEMIERLWNLENAPYDPVNGCTGTALNRRLTRKVYSSNRWEGLSRNDFLSSPLGGGNQASPSEYFVMQYDAEAIDVDACNFPTAFIWQPSATQPAPQSCYPGSPQGICPFFVLS